MKKYIRAGANLGIIVLAVLAVERYLNRYTVKPLTRQKTPLAVVWTPEVL